MLDQVSLSASLPCFGGPPRNGLRIWNVIEEES